MAKAKRKRASKRPRTSAPVKDEGHKELQDPAVALAEASHGQVDPVQHVPQDVPHSPCPRELM